MKVQALKTTTHDINIQDHGINMKHVKLSNEKNHPTMLMKKIMYSQDENCPINTHDNSSKMAPKRTSLLQHEVKPKK